MNTNSGWKACMLLKNLVEIAREKPTPTIIFARVKRSFIVTK